MLPPSFTSPSSMTPILITKNVEIGNERWKPSPVEDNSKNIPAGELPQSFIASDGNIYYFPQEIVNGYQPLQNGTVNGHEPQLFQQQQQQQQLNGPDLVNHTIQIDTVPNDIPSDELKRLIRLQFEYYFCRENLANDSYLVSQMDSDQYVYIATVAKFNQVRKLTSDMNLIIEALKESPYVQLDESAQKVRANMKRCIVILREIPESTPIDELKALFCHPNCPKWVSFEFAHNDSWYITFDCEEDAKIAYRYLHEEVKHFHGRPLMARIKAKTLLSRTVYLPKNLNAPSSVSGTCTTAPPVSSTQFTTAQQPLNTFAVPPNATIYQPQTFPFYAATHVNGAVNGPIIPGTWIRPRPATIFIQQDIHPNFNSFNKHKPDNFQFISNKGRVPNRNNFKNPKVPLQHRGNGVLDNDDRQTFSSLRRSSNPHDGSNTFSAFRKDDDRRFGSNVKKDFRTNVEESPRFQRLRERRHHKEEVPKTQGNIIESKKKHLSNDLTLDLAIENFPALPIPNSPNDDDKKTASSLKELASSALQRVHEQSTSPSNDNDSNEICQLSHDEKSIETSLSDKLTDTSISTTSVCSSNILSQTPKISYAQMAQKLNQSAHLKETFESDDKVFMELTADAEVTKSSNDPIIKCQNECAPEMNTPMMNTPTVKPQRKTSQGSQKPRRSSKSNLPEVDNCSIDCQLGNDSSAPHKETYASKFGKVNNNIKSQVTGQLSLSKSVSTCTSTANLTSANLTWPDSQSKGPTKNLPSPKPLMSQIIKTPTHEKGHQQIIEEISQKIPVTNNDDTGDKTVVSEGTERKVEHSSSVEEVTAKKED